MRSLSLAVVTTLLALAATAGPAAAQTASQGTLHATLRGWEERARLRILDRSGAYFGRASERGILQRFNEKMDTEYHLDLITSGYTLSEVYDWYQRENGARFWAGSINHRLLVQEGELAARVWLSDAWAIGARFAHQQTLNADRNLIRLGLTRRFAGGRAGAFLETTFIAEKSEIDAELGFNWSPGAGEITVAVAALDLFNDVVYQGLEVSPTIADTAIDYTSHPFTLRVAADLPVGRRFRLEGYGLVLTPTRVVYERQTAPGVGFSQDERYAYAGGLLEWMPDERTTAGGTATWERARTERAALPEGRPEDDYDLTEVTWSLGAYGQHRFNDRFHAEAWLAHVWRTEDRVRPDTTVAPNVDYEDHTWAGLAHFVYRAHSGFRAELGFGFVERAISGDDRLPGAFDRSNSRLRFDFGWQFGERALLLFGSNLDLDGDDRSVNFDGGHGRLALNW